MSGISGIGHSNGVVTFNMNNTSARQKGGDEKKTLFAGDMNLNQDGIFARKHRAQKEALKILNY